MSLGKLWNLEALFLDWRPTADNKPTYTADNLNQPTDPVLSTVTSWRHWQ